jgi:flagellar hook-associated protein 3 FlgL
MRITQDMNFRMMSDSLSKQQLDLRKYQQQISSGVRVAKGSDDPGAYGQIRTLYRDSAQLEQYARNADKASQYHGNVDQSLTQAISLMHRINELVVQGGDGTLDQVSRDALAEEVNALLETMVGVANGSDGGSHLFGGLRTDVAPYETVVDPASGRITAVQYVGSEETRTIKTGDSLYVATNHPGSTSTSEAGVFQTATRDVFDSIIRLRDALSNGDEISDSDIPGRLQGDLDHMLDTVSLNGVRDEQVRMHKTYLLEMQSSNAESKEALESVDVAQTLMKLSESEVAYEAVLQSTARMMQQVNLMNFI